MMNNSPRRASARRLFTAARFAVTLSLALIVYAASLMFDASDHLPFQLFQPSVHAGNTYANLSSGNLSFAITAATANVITSNDNWSGFASVEGYSGQNLTATHGIDPQTVVGTEHAGYALPNSPRNVAANKGNPNAFNAGGLAEFDSGPYLALGFQGNVQANPYLVFYVNSSGRSNVTISYDVTDIDSGSNNAVSRLALQYRVGSTGPFTNVPAGYVADATDGPNLGGRVTSKSVMLPSNTWNKPQVQIRLITTNAADTSGASTPDEWIGVNNVVVSSIAPTAGPVEIAGRVLSDTGRSVYGANVYATDGAGNIRRVMTNSFGYFRFTALSAGETYVLNVASRQYTYAPMVVTPTDDLFDLNFVAVRLPALPPPPPSSSVMQETQPASVSPLKAKSATQVFQ